MTHNYKIWDKVLVEAELVEKSFGLGHELVLIKTQTSNGKLEVHNKFIRPYTPRQEFEYGEEVEVSDSGNQWVKAKYIGKSHDYNVNPYDTYVVNPISSNGHLCGTLRFRYCRKISEVKPRETITIAGVTYDKAEFENAVKDLKPVEGK